MAISSTLIYSNIIEVAVFQTPCRGSTNIYCFAKADVTLAPIRPSIRTGAAAAMYHCFENKESTLATFRFLLCIIFFHASIKVSIARLDS